MLNYLDFQRDGSELMGNAFSRVKEEGAVEKLKIDRIRESMPQKVCSRWPKRQNPFRVSALALTALLCGMISAANASNGDNLDYNRRATATAQIMAGIQPNSGDAALDRLTRLEGFAEHQKWMAAQWNQVRGRIAAMESWRSREIRVPGAQKRTMLYPFSGPDFINAYALFPEYPRYIFFSLERPGSIPDLESVTPAQFTKLLQDVRGAFRDIFERNYFITDYMNKQLTTPWIRGTVPVMATMMALMNVRIVRIEPIDLFPELTRIYDSPDAIAHPRRIMRGSPTEAHTQADAVARPTTPYVEMSFGMGKDGYPAISMTQHAANTYCKWLSANTGHFYRLPTEAEWEYACRAGTTTAYSFGDDPAQLKDYAWFVDNSEGKYQKVGKKKPNPWGLYDMHGNVMEWTLDQYDPQSYKQFTAAVTKEPWVKPTKPYPHVARGGGWDDDPDKLRSAARRASDRSWKMQDPQLPKSIWYLTDAQWLGFRVIRPLKVPSPEEMEKFWHSGTERD